MSTPFADRDARSNAAIARVFGELCTLTAMKAATGDVNLPAVADGSRAAFDVTGTWEGAAKSRLPHARGSVQDDTAQGFLGSAPSVSIADADLRWAVIEGDLVRRQFDNSTWRVSKVLPDGNGRTLLKLTSRKR